MDRLLHRTRLAALIAFAGVGLAAAASPAANVTWTGTNPGIEARVDALLAQMTLDEKVGQLNQYSSEAATGPFSACLLYTSDAADE